MDTSVDNNVQTSCDNNVDSVVEVKKQARLLQLAQARESAKSKKRAREQDLSEIKTQLSSLTSALKTQKQEDKLETVVEVNDDEPPKKRVRVTKEPAIVDEEEDETEQEVEKESWSTMLLRSSALFGLGIGSWYFQHKFQRPAQIKQTPKTAQQSHKILPPLHRAVPATKVIGKSGFFM